MNALLFAFTLEIADLMETASGKIFADHHPSYIMCVRPACRKFVGDTHTQEKNTTRRDGGYYINRRIDVDMVAYHRTRRNGTISAFSLTEFDNPIAYGALYEIGGNKDANIQSGSLAIILKGYRQALIPNKRSIHSAVVIPHDIQIWPQLLGSRILRNLIRPSSLGIGLSGFYSRACELSPRQGIGRAGFVESPNNKGGSGEAENSPKPRRKYLFFGGIRSPYLGIQIAGIVLAAFSLSALTGFCLFRTFNYGHGKRLWLTASVLSGLLGLFFWGWGWAGNPLSAWGLAR